MDRGSETQLQVGENINEMDVEKGGGVYGFSSAYMCDICVILCILKLDISMEHHPANTRPNDGPTLQAL